MQRGADFVSVYRKYSHLKNIVDQSDKLHKCLSVRHFAGKFAIGPDGRECFIVPISKEDVLDGKKLDASSLALYEIINANPFLPGSFSMKITYNDYISLASEHSDLLNDLEVEMLSGSLGSTVVKKHLSNVALAGDLLSDQDQYVILTQPNARHLLDKVKMCINDDLKLVGLSAALGDLSIFAAATEKDVVVTTPPAVLSSLGKRS